MGEWRQQTFFRDDGIVIGGFFAQQRRDMLLQGLRLARRIEREAIDAMDLGYNG